MHVVGVSLLELVTLFGVALLRTKGRRTDPKRWKPLLVCGELFIVRSNW